MDPSSSPATARISQRAPKSCHRCSIKKMKCPKTIPCAPCIDSGMGGQCRREEVITTKHMRQAHRRSRRESVNRTTEYTHNTSVKGALQDRIHLTGVDRLAAFPSQFVAPGIHEISYSESQRHGHDYEEDMSSATVSSLRAPGQLARGHHESPGPVIAAEVESSTYNEQADIENAANSLELLAWGRQRDSGLSPTAAMVLNVATRNTDILLPRQARLVLCYHRDWITWTHNTIHWPTFFSECQDYWLEGIVVEKGWLAIYYAALCVRPCQPSV